jgi:hypothetical protein
MRLSGMNNQLKLVYSAGTAFTVAGYVFFVNINEYLCLESMFFSSPQAMCGFFCVKLNRAIA